MQRRAFSLIELLVVIGILAVLIGMLLPAVQVVRSAASRMQCSSNLHQLVVTMQAYHDENRRFPSGINLPISGQSGAVFPSNPLVITGKVKEPLLPGHFISWCEALLPYFEQDNLHRNLDLKRRDYVNAKGPESPGAQVIAILLCPADNLPKNVTTYQDGSGEVHYFGMNSYGANGGTRSFPVGQMRTDGMFFINSNLRIDKISDGLGNTVMFGERYHFDPNYHDLSGGQQFENLVGLGGWAWANYNAPQDYLFSSAVPVNFRIPNGITGRDAQETMNDERLNAYGSGHPGGANFAFCDGSVRFLTLTSNRSLPLLQALSTPAGGDKSAVID